MENQALKVGDTVIVISNATSNSLIGMGFKKGTICVVDRIKDDTAIRVRHKDGYAWHLAITLQKQ